jgi:hypothetical protein
MLRRLSAFFGEEREKGLGAQFWLSYRFLMGPEGRGRPQKKILCRPDVNQLTVFKFGSIVLYEIKWVLKNYDIESGPKLKNYER